MSSEYPTLANNRYEIHQCIGKGGMAAVFKCFDRRLKTVRAIKVLHPEFVVRSTVRARFTTEAVAMANLNHPNIVHVYDHGLEELTAFLVMEYLPHGSLQSYLDKRGPLSKPQAIAVCLDIASALSMAHQQGIIHRDIKPDNILLSPSGAKLSDFGLARMEDDDRKVTKTRAVMGTFPYMSPEQRLSAKKTTHQSDIYALAASLFVMLTGLDPTDLYDESERVKLLDGIDFEIQKVVVKGCLSDLQMRYATVEELITDLQAIFDSLDTNTAKLSLDDVLSSDQSSTDRDQLLSMWQEYTGTTPDAFGLSADNEPANSAAETLIFQSSLDESEDIFQPDLEKNELQNPPNSEAKPVNKGMLGENELQKKENHRVWFILLALILAFILVTTVLLTAASKELAESRSVISSHHDHEQIYLLQDPDSEADQKQFKKAKTAFLKGDYSDSERILQPIKAKYEKEPAVYNLSALIHIMQGRMDQSLIASEQASANSKTVEGDGALMFVLADQSWRERDNAQSLLLSWKDLRSENTDPMVEINYLVYAQPLLGEGYYTELRRARETHPDWATLAILEVSFLEQLGDSKAALKTVEQAIAQFPSAVSLMVQRAEIQIRLEEYAAAEENMKQLLVREPNTAAAHALLAGIYAHLDQDDKRLKHMLLALGDEIPKSEQLDFMQTYARHLINQGQEKEAHKLWNFCIDSALDCGDQLIALQCASSKVESSVLLDSAYLDASISKLKELNSAPGLATEIKKKYAIQLLSIELYRHLKNGDSKEANLAFLAAQKSVFEDSIFAEQDHMVEQLEHEIWLHQNNKDALGELQVELEAHALTQKETCEQSFLRHRVADALGEHQRSEKALKSIVTQSCSGADEFQGLIKAKSYYLLVESELRKSSKSQRLSELISEFNTLWPAPDEGISWVQTIERIKEKNSDSE